MQSIKCLTSAIFLAILLMPSTAMSEQQDAQYLSEQGPKTQKAIQKTRTLRPKRVLASLTPAESTRANIEDKAVSNGQGSSLLKFGVLAAFSRLDGSVFGADSGGYGVSFGLTGDLDIFKYAGLEVDSSLTYGPGQSSTALIETNYQEKNSRLVLSNFVNAKVQLPIQSGDTKIVPRVGAGWAHILVKDTQELAFSSQSSSDSTVSELSGPFFLVGLDFSPFTRWSFSADYSRSFMVSGSTSFAQSGNYSHDQELNNGTFERMRFGASYRIAQRASLGVQYAIRNLNYNFIAGSSSNVPTGLKQQMFSGFVLFNLF